MSVQRTVTMVSALGFALGAGVVFGGWTDVINHQDGAEGAQVEALPRIVNPGETDAQPPADAIVLFDGTSLDAWKHPDGRDVEWALDEDDRSMTIQPGTGPIITRETHGACQLHIEFATPAPSEREGQGRGNSGVYLQAKYEVQILDSFENETYADGQCGAIYGQYPPLVNACRAPGEWQTYDIIFHPPAFDEDGTKLRAGIMTVFHNGVLIQDHVELQGSTTASMLKEGPGDGHLYLQDHGNAVRYRNIWIRPLP